MMEKMPKPGEFYRHFNNTLYQIVTIAQHTETGEPLVVYQALYGGYHVYARPLSMFLSEVDRGKHTEARQKYRFEQVFFADGKMKESQQRREAPEWQKNLEQRGEFKSQELSAGTKEPEENPYRREEAQWPGEQDSEVNPWLERFLDAEGYDQQMYVLKQMIGKVGQREVDSIYLVLDISMPAKAGDVDSQIRGIIKTLETRKRYDGGRLR